MNDMQMKLRIIQFYISNNILTIDLPQKHQSLLTTKDSHK